MVTVNDPRCPITQSRIFRDRLLDLVTREGEGTSNTSSSPMRAMGARIPCRRYIRTFTIQADYLDRAV